MIGSSASAFSGRFSRCAPRSATSAIIVPSTVVPVAVSSARNSVFQATPQRTPPARQPRPQLRSLKTRSTSARERRVAGVVDEGAGERLGHRQRDEQREQHAAQHHRAGGEGVAAEPAESRDADAEQHQQRQQRQRAAQADARLPGRQRAEQPRQRVEGPAGRADRETAGQDAGRAEQRGRREPRPLPPSAREPRCQAREQQAGERKPEPRARVQRGLDCTARGVGRTEHTRQRLQQRLVGLQVPRQQQEGRDAADQPGIDRHARARAPTPRSGRGRQGASALRRCA